MNIQAILLYLILFTFTIYAFLSTHASELETISIGMTMIKYMILTAFVLFTLYTIYVTTRENLFKSVKRMFDFRWGRQIILDLYLGLFLFGFVVYLVEKTFLITLLWLSLAIIFGNIISLLYFASQFDRILVFFYQ